MKVMWSSDSVLVPTGMGKQSLHFSRWLGKNLEIDMKVMCWQYFGRRLNGFGEDTQEPFDILPCAHAAYGQKMYDKYYQLEKPDVLVTLGDAWMVNVITRIPRAAEWIAYYPVDGDPLSRPIYDIIKYANIRVAMSYWGKHHTEQSGLDAEYIPHVVDPNIYKPLGDKIKQQLKEGIGWGDRFIFGVVSRPNPRKHLYRLFQAYGYLLRENPELKKTTGLYLHMDVDNDPMKPEDFYEALDYFGIEPNVKITNHPYMQGITEEQLNEIYNMFDVQMLPTGGEGFGVTMIEGGKSGCPTIATDFTTPREIFRGGQCGMLIPASRLVTEPSGVRKAWIDIDKLKDGMKYLIDNPDVIKKYQYNLKKVMPYYHIDNICPKMEKLVLNCNGNIDFTELRYKPDKMDNYYPVELKT